MTEGNIRKTLAAGFRIVRKRKVKMDVRRVHWVIEELKDLKTGWVEIHDISSAYIAKDVYVELVKDPDVLEMHHRHNVNN